MSSYKRTFAIFIDKHSLFMCSFYIMILTLILNGNKYVAGIRFILLPIILFVASSLIETRNPIKISIPICSIILLFVSALYSTLTSDVVSWGNSATSLLLFIVLYVAISNIMFNASMIRRILRFYALSVTIICLVMLISYSLGHNVIDGRISISFLGVRKDENYLAAFLTPGYSYLLYSFLFGENHKAWSIISLGIIFLAIFLSGSRAAFLTILTVSLIMIFKILFTKYPLSTKILLIIALVLGAVIGLMYLRSTPLFTRMTGTGSYSSNIRLKIWGYALQAFTRHPLIGSGIESGTFYVQLILRWYTHSVFVDILTGQGLIGVIICLILFLNHLRVKKENFIYMAIMLIAFFAPMFFINGYETATFWVPMIMCKVISDYCKANDANILLLS